MLTWIYWWHYQPPEKNQPQILRRGKWELQTFLCIIPLSSLTTLVIKHTSPQTLLEAFQTEIPHLGPTPCPFMEIMFLFCCILEEFDDPNQYGMLWCLQRTEFCLAGAQLHNLRTILRVLSETNRRTLREHFPPGFGLYCRKLSTWLKKQHRFSGIDLFAKWGEDLAIPPFCVKTANLLLLKSPSRGVCRRHLLLTRSVCW